MTVTAHKLRMAVAHPVMLLVTHMHDPVVGTKTIGVNRRRKLDTSAQDGLNTGFRAIRDDLCINRTLAFVDAEDNGFATRTASARASDTACPKVTFIEFDITCKGRLPFTIASDGLAHKAHIAVDRVAIQARNFGNLRGSQIKRKEAQKLAKFGARNWCASKLFGNTCDDLEHLTKPNG